MSPTYRQLYLCARGALRAAGIEDPGTDAALLCARFLGLDRPGLAVYGEEPCPPSKREAFLRAVAERSARRPLQYILGRWEFMGLSLEVGEGVLVPREDTAVLVEQVAGRLGGAGSPRGLDLCAGTGAVGLGLCGLRPDARVTCVEISPAALAYLRRNVAAYPQYQVEARQGDVLEGPRGFPQGLDFLAANPPYIAAGELAGLQPEVRKEPALALDGGPDGLGFYRAIGALWAPLLRAGGVLGVEIGETQARDVCAIFQKSGFTGLAVHQDWAGLDRAVTGVFSPAPGV